MKINTTPKLTLFHCLNSFEETASLFDGCQMKTVKMACSSMTKDIHLLKAFEAGADAVLVLVCPEKGCRYAQGSIRARKRVDYVKSILDDIGMDGRRLNIFNTAAKDSGSIRDIIQNTILDLETIGPNPALTRCN
ncbi:MAG: hydrogenase iron-sulfur subunit [Proteobacteria bacterium]|nr:hydrogenase iron-sulfur subunit [Pseudomonadota bacterium]MBU1583395.1 hydrogenase iron-sulfur subunit [Pseudomonadota bacterium]MBU2454983.1 hydrogenase iron-sulfur subunit [Pseudomonadota bacterium]MBU2629679.1 hydrogenase iron-sulfur subunit [Pseudomonadota bacterium]